MSRGKDAEAPFFDAVKLTPVLRAYFRRRVAAHEADDLVQEVFVRLQRRRATDEVEEIDRFVFTVAGNVLMDHHKKERRWSLSFLTEKRGDTDPISPETSLLGKQQLSEALDVLERLPERTRTIFLLHRFEGVSHAVIADSLGISRSAVEKHIIRAAKALQGLGED